MKNDPAAFSSTVLTLERTRDYEFVVRVGGDNAHEYLTGEGPPLGSPGVPEASELLGAAVATCLASSLLFCTQKAHVKIDALSARVNVEKVRNEKGRLRVGSIDVSLSVGLTDDQREHFTRCSEIFEEYCVATQSVRSGIPVTVTVSSANL
jgi:organic hydroperoxide reductase OsmC/OhrA